LIATARREFTEETGFVARGPFTPLVPVKQKSGKTVHAFACAGDFDPGKLVSNTFEMEWPPKSGKRESFPEIDRVAWFSLEAAREKILTYQLPFLDELEALLGS
jgi:predicted NUDIX family NTP pyrophosphohydrolase